MPDNITPLRPAPQFSREELAEFATLAKTMADVGIRILDTLGGDPDCEADGDELDGNASEDDFMHHSGLGPGCPIADPDTAVDDGPCDDIAMDLEPDTDAEVETWSHWMDHPPELHIGKRTGWNDGPEAA